MDNPETRANKRQRKAKEQSRMNNPETLVNKRQRKAKEQSRMNNPETLVNKRQRKAKGNQEWTIQRHGQINVREKRRAIKNEKSRETSK